MTNQYKDDSIAIDLGDTRMREELIISRIAHNRGMTLDRFKELQQMALEGTTTTEQENEIARVMGISKFVSIDATDGQ